MSSQPSVLVTLDGDVCDPGQPLLFADDLAAVRGDGVFETMLVRDGRACLVEAHLQRLLRSAWMMELPTPDLTAWRRAIATAVQQWNLLTTAEGALRLVYSRGRESGSTHGTAYLMINVLADRVALARRDGVAAVLLDRGLPVAGVAHMPWLLAGAKTLSYAVNMAAIRYGAAHGADDVIFVSSDGYILEGPRSTVVIATAEAGRPRLLTPPLSHPILRGTTQQALFEVASARGYVCDYAALRPADLDAAQGIWLVSSITLGARVHTLDGRALDPPSCAPEIAALVEAAIVSDC
ncbi:MAG: aminodeoxychorismate lyase [Mycobacterium sp.]